MKTEIKSEDVDTVTHFFDDVREEIAKGDPMKGDACHNPLCKAASRIIYEWLREDGDPSEYAVELAAICYYIFKPS